MKLGYLMIPHASNTGGNKPDAGRAEMAQALGISEFYSVEPQDQTLGSCAIGAYPEHASALRTHPDYCEKPLPQIVAVNGELQSISHASDAPNLTHPAATPQQVAANASARKTSMSVSWLTTADLARHWAAHVSGSTHAGLRARPEDWHIARTIMVCDDAARAQAAVKSDDSPCRAYYSRMITPGMDIEAVLDACVLYGSLETVLDDLQDILATTGPFGTLTFVDHAWPDQGMAQQSLAALTLALAPKVPHVKASYPSALNRKLS